MQSLDEENFENHLKSNNGTVTLAKTGDKGVQKQSNEWKSNHCA